MKRVMNVFVYHCFEVMQLKGKVVNFVRNFKQYTKSLEGGYVCPIFLPVRDLKPKT